MFMILRNFDRILSFWWSFGVWSYSGICWYFGILLVLRYVGSILVFLLYVCLLFVFSYFVCIFCILMVFVYFGCIFVLWWHSGILMVFLYFGHRLAPWAGER